MNSVILRTVTKYLIPFIQLYGFYVIFHGHLSPGGGFAGGAVVGSSMILYTLVFGLKESKKIVSHKFTAILETGGILAYIFLGLVGVFWGKSFLTNLATGIQRGEPFSLFSAGIILYLSLAIGFKVASTIVTLFFTLLEDDQT
jgi:multicomponent Na+:H+ antiporter subunit B